MPQTKKTTGTARKTSGKKTTAKKQTKTAPAKNARNAESYEFLSRAAPYILAAVAILLAVCIDIGRDVYTVNWAAEKLGEYIASGKTPPESEEKYV